jgi:hypothetical protein
MFGKGLKSNTDFGFFLVFAVFQFIFSNFNSPCFKILQKSSNWVSLFWFSILKIEKLRNRTPRSVCYLARKVVSCCCCCCFKILQKSSSWVSLFDFQFWRLTNWETAPRPAFVIWQMASDYCCWRCMQVNRYSFHFSVGPFEPFIWKLLTRLRGKTPPRLGLLDPASEGTRGHTLPF